MDSKVLQVTLLSRNGESIDGGGLLVGTVPANATPDEIWHTFQHVFGDAREVCVKLTWLYEDGSLYEDGTPRILFVAGGRPGAAAPLRISPSGGIYIHGEKCDDNERIYVTLCRLLGLTPSWRDEWDVNMRLVDMGQGIDPDAAARRGLPKGWRTGKPARVLITVERYLTEEAPEELRIEVFEAATPFDTLVRFREMYDHIYAEDDRLRKEAGGPDAAPRAAPQTLNRGPGAYV